MDAEEELEACQVSLAVALVQVMGRAHDEKVRLPLIRTTSTPAVASRGDVAPWGEYVRRVQ